MSWCALDITAADGARDRVAAWLVGRTGQAVEERPDGTLVGFTRGAAAAGSLVAELRTEFGAALRAGWRLLPDVDWTEQWRAGLGPRAIGRLVVTPSWTTEAAGGAAVVIDPESAFGTGEHGSTRSALVLLDRHLRPGDRVLDLGSGSGILAIAAVKLGASRATGVDLDPEVESIARANVERNGVAGRAACLTGDAALLAPLLAPADLIASNILRQVNVALLGIVRAALAPAGRAIFAGMEGTERALFLPELAAAGLAPFDEAADGSWWSVAVRSA